MEVDNHADTCVAGANCVILAYTGKECDVSPYRDDYEPVTNVPIVHAGTAWTSKRTGQTYILVLNECLGMIDTMDHTLVNPNQLRHFGVRVQDNPMSSRPLSIITENNEFCMELAIEGTIVFAETRTPTLKELNECPHVQLTSSSPWIPSQVKFPGSSMSLEDEVGGMRYLSGVKAHHEIECQLLEQEEDVTCFSLESINRRIASMKVAVVEEAKLPEALVRDESVDPGSADVPELHTFQSSDRHTDVSPADLSERWNISIATAIQTLKKTTQKFLRSAVLPLARRYRADRVFERKTLAGSWSTDTMDGRSKSLEGNRYAQVFANKAYFSRIYPMDSKSKAGDALRLFCQELGVPEKLTFDGSKEQNGKGTEFMRQIRRHDIDYHVTEADLHNQNPAEGVIRETRRKWYRVMIRKRVPEPLWDYGVRWVSETSSLTHTSAGGLNGCIPITQVTGETADISEYLDFGFYDEVWYKDNAGLSPYEPGRWLGVSHRTGRLMCYHILTQKGTVISRSTVQRVTNLEKQTMSVKDIFNKFDEGIRIKLKTIDRGYIGDKPDPKDWADLIDEDEDFREEFERVFNNEDIPEADDNTPEVLNDTYVNMEIALPRDESGPQYAKVTKRLRDANGIPIGTANDNPFLDTRVYEVEYLDGRRDALSANIIAENLFAQVDDEGNRFVLLDSIADHRVNGSQVTKDQAKQMHGEKKGLARVATTKGWEILLQWKDGSSTWESLKDVKECYPVQMAEYALQKKISNEPAFAWWVPYVLKKKQRIVSKVKSKYWQRTHKFGIRIPKNVEEACRFDRENGNTLWWEAICKEMKNVRIAFEEWKGDGDLPPGYQQIKCHIIFDVKMGENFRRKARMVAGGHVTETPSALTYSSVVSRDSVRIALTIAALNDLKVLACDIQNAYLTAPCREKIWTIAGPEFGPEDCGKKMLVVRALYGLKSSGAAFRAFLAEKVYDLGFTPSKADPDVWMRPAIKEDGFKYWEYLLTYVDDCLCISHAPDKVLTGIAGKFTLKDNKMDEPEMYLGASLSKMTNEENHECWAMSSDKYCAAMIKNVEDVLEKKGLRLPSKCITPLRSGYKPELDCTGELKADGLQWYQEMIGSLRWAVEIGRVDILLEVSVMSKYLAMPREGHLEQVLHIMGYLKSHKKLRLMFDSSYPGIDERWFTKYDWQDFYRDAKEAIPPNMPEARGRCVTICCFVDANHAGDVVDRRSQTGVLIFMNRSPIHWYSKRQATVEVSTFGAEYCALRVAVEMIESLRYKLRMFGVPIDGSASVFCDNESVYKNTAIPESTLKKKHHSIAYHRCREAVAAGTIRVAKQGTTKNLADLFTKVLTAARRSFLLERFTY